MPVSVASPDTALTRKTMPNMLNRMNIANRVMFFTVKSSLCV